MSIPARLHNGAASSHLARASVASTCFQYRILFPHSRSAFFHSGRKQGKYEEESLNSTEGSNHRPSEDAFVLEPPNHGGLKDNIRQWRRTASTRERNRPSRLRQPSAYYDLSSTRPPRFDRPDAPTGDSLGHEPKLTDRVKWYYRLARTYFTFYKTGMIQVWRNYKQYREIAPRARQIDKIHWTVPPENLIPSLKSAFDSGLITRREYQLYLRTRRDLRKTIPFSLILLVFGEFSPLVLLLLSNHVPKIVPFTCLTPSEVCGFLGASKRVESVDLRNTTRDPNPADMDIIPSSFTWSDWSQKLAAMEKMSKQSSDVYRKVAFGRNWFRPKRSSSDRPLADALLILWEGGTETLDPREVLMWVWQTHDPYLYFLWADAHSRLQRKNIENVPYDPELDLKGWNSSVETVDLRDVREELQRTLEELVRRSELYFKTGKDLGLSMAKNKSHEGIAAPSGPDKR